MWLIRVQDLELIEFIGDDGQVPEYGILSHTWDKDEVTFQDFTASNPEIKYRKLGFRKIQKVCELAKENGLQYVWADTCCIDKKSSAELTEAINSMFRWYSNAVVCYVWLSDLPAMCKEKVWQRETALHLKKCRWFTRGWTLQELIAPRRVQFFNRDWRFCGSKEVNYHILSEISRVDIAVLRNAAAVQDFSIASRMSWAALRKTTRIEDMAYCLLGIFNVNMPMLYGEGRKSFTRLQEAILRESNDTSLFAWQGICTDQANRGIFAESPFEFRNSGSIKAEADALFQCEYVLTNKGLRISLEIFPASRGKGDPAKAALNCWQEMHGRKAYIGIWVQKNPGGVYSRLRCHQFAPVSSNEAARLDFRESVLIYRDLSVSQSMALARNHQNSFIFRRGFHQPGYKRGFFSEYYEADHITPIEAWDRCGSRFVVGEGSDFAAYIHFVPQNTTGAFGDFAIICGKNATSKKPWMIVTAELEKYYLLHPSTPPMPDKEQQRTIQLPSMSTNTCMKIKASLETGTIYGDKVYYIDLDEVLESTNS